jgi:predicted acyltransferase
MYHCQVPPPNHIFNPNLPGITWVDLVFPFFLFSMGAAIPLALTRRLEKGEPVWRIISHIIWRGAVLAAVAIYLGNSSPWAVSDSPGLMIWLRSLLGFCCWLLCLVRFDTLNLPIDFKRRPWLKYLIRMVGLSGLILLMASVQYKDGTGFSKERDDIIIRILAFGYTAGSILWLISRNSLFTRCAIIAGIYALRLHNTANGIIISTIDNWIAPIHWLFGAGWIQVASIILFGTIIGDFLVQFGKRKDVVLSNLGLSRVKAVAVIITLGAVVVGGVIYLYTRWVLTGFLFTVSCGLLVYCLFKRTETEVGKLLKTLFNWGFFFLIIGYIIEPYEGGIKKDPATPPYYFVCSGMAIALLIVFFIIIDIYKKGWTVGFLRVVGSNPLLAYIMGSGFVYPILHITHAIDPIDALVANNVALGTVWAFGLTFIVCAVVYLFSKLKIYVRV